jgi:hypothetical protein
MRSEAATYCSDTGWRDASGAVAGVPDFRAGLVIVFGAREALVRSDLFQALQTRYPGARIAGCSTGGQIARADVSDSEFGVLALQFERSSFSLVEAGITSPDQSGAVGVQLGQALRRDDLKAVFVLSDGTRVNGSRLVAGLHASLGPDVSITGGLAGDGARFEQTLVMLDDHIAIGRVVAIGFYGASFRVGHGCRDGWSEFGPRRVMTKACDTVLFELDGKPALDLYKRYLGAEAAGLPATGLLYPMMLTDPDNPAHRVIRTVMAVDEEAQSLTFAGDMPEGWHAQLMRGHFDQLSDAAGEAAASAMACAQGETAAVLISCIGRRLVMGENTIDEIAAARAALGANVASAGFYSYGEISPHAVSGCCELHNQTMTVTTFSEA